MYKQLIFLTALPLCTKTSMNYYQYRNGITWIRVKHTFICFVLLLNAHQKVIPVTVRQWLLDIHHFGARLIFSHRFWWLNDFSLLWKSTKRRRNWLALPSGCALVAHCVPFHPFLGVQVRLPGAQWHCGQGCGASGPQKPEGTRCSEMHSQPYLRPKWVIPDEKYLCFGKTIFPLFAHFWVAGPSACGALPLGLGG